MRNLIVFILIGGIVACARSGNADPSAEVSTRNETPSGSADGDASVSDDVPFVQQSIRGQVDWLADVLKRRFGIESDPDVAEAAVALDASDGRIVPLVKDDRGRGFWKDERIRGIPVELYVRQYEDSPLAQVIRVYTIKDGGKYEFDYWCDICAIPMYELKPCECCQGPIVIRERLVEPSTIAENSSSNDKPSTVPMGGSR